MDTVIVSPCYTSLPELQQGRDQEIRLNSAILLNRIEPS
jgi:hypothetical protein